MLQPGSSVVLTRLIAQRGVALAYGRPYSPRQTVQDGVEDLPTPSLAQLKLTMAMSARFQSVAPTATLMSQLDGLPLPTLIERRPWQVLGVLAVFGSIMIGVLSVVSANPAWFDVGARFERTVVP